MGGLPFHLRVFIVLITFILWQHFPHSNKSWHLTMEENLFPAILYSVITKFKMHVAERIHTYTWIIAIAIQFWMSGRVFII